MDRLQVYAWPSPGLGLAPFYHLSCRCHRPPPGIMTGPVMNCGLSYLVRRKPGEDTTRRKRHFPYKNCLTVALRRQIRVRIQVIQLCWLCSVQCTLVQRRQAVQHRTDYLELVPQQHSLSVIHLMPILPRCAQCPLLSK